MCIRDRAFQAYDNVKVNRLTLSRAYGVLKNDGTYVKQNFTLVRSIDGIPADDYEPVTTLNIDTPEYNQLMHVDRLFAILQGFGLASSDVKRVDVLLRVEAFDAANSQAYEVGYPVRVDERPTLDVAEPAPGAKVVEGNPLYVNVKAFDDVGIEYVNIIATYGNGQTPYIQRLRTSPYNFMVPVPAFDNANPDANRIHLAIEAVDTYGVAHNDFDAHRAEESLDVEIIRDQLPSVVIATPKDGAESTEGQLLLVEVNAVDDVGVDRVVLNLSLIHI